MGISGYLAAKCKECSCRFNWYIGDNWPFVDSEIVGTCDNCFEHKSHDCVDEYQESEGGGFVIVGRKGFSPAEPGQGAFQNADTVNAKPHTRVGSADSVGLNECPPESSAGEGQAPSNLSNAEMLLGGVKLFEEHDKEMKKQTLAATRAVLEKTLPCESHQRNPEIPACYDFLVTVGDFDTLEPCPNCRARKAIEDGLERMRK